MENTLAIRLKKLREENQLSVKQLCEKIDVPETTYREWEMGRQIKGHQPYVKIAQIYKISTHELLTGERPKQIEVLQQVEKLATDLHDLKKMLNALN